MTQGYRPPTPIIVRLNLSVEKTVTCWNWKKRCNRTGYGVVGIGSRINGSRKTVLAHRLSYQTFIGEIPNGMCVLHRCDNPACIKPSHLFLGTIADNVADMMTKGRHNTKRGEDIGTAKLTVSKVVRIKKLFGRLNDGQIARKFDVSNSIIWNIRKGISWRHIEV